MGREGGKPLNLVDGTGRDGTTRFFCGTGLDGIRKRVGYRVLYASQCVYIFVYSSNVLSHSGKYYTYSYSSQLVSSHIGDYGVFIHDQIENIPPPPSSALSRKTAHRPPKNPTRPRKKSKEKLSNDGSVSCTYDTLPATTAVFTANAASTAASCSAFKLPNSLTTFPSPGIWTLSCGA